MAVLNNYGKTIHTKTVTWDENGIAQGTIVYRIGASTAVSDAQQTKSHPDYHYLKRTGGSVKFLEANMAEVTLDFSGVDPDANGQVQTTIRATMTNEPIDTHPKFTEWSKKFAPILNPDGSFKKFDSKIKQKDADGNDQEINNPKAGIKDYLDPSVTYEQSKIFAFATNAQLANEIKNIGYIDSSFYEGVGIPVPPTPIGDDGKPRNWLLVSGSFEEIGEGGKVTKVWRLSGRRRWDSIIYDKNNEAPPNQVN